MDGPRSPSSTPLSFVSRLGAVGRTLRTIVGTSIGTVPSDRSSDRSDQSDSRRTRTTRTRAEHEAEPNDRSAGDVSTARRRRLRVLVVGPVQATGGIARYIAELRERLPETVTVTVYDTAVPQGSGTIRFIRGLVRSLADAVRFPFRRRPDLVHVHTAEYYSFLRKSAYVLLTKYVWRRPVVLHVHGPTFDRYVERASPPLRALQRLVFDASDAIVVLSPYWKRALEPYLPAEKVLVLPNAVDVDEYDPAFPETPHVVFVSNHYPRKGLVEFVEAIDRLKGNESDEGVPAFRVSIAGSGPLSEHAERLADRYEGVEYLGYVSEAEKRRLLCAASIYVLPAYAEGLPIGVLEGMAGGNAVVATAVGGVPDLIDEDGGVLVDPGDERALADAIRSLLGAPDRTRAMGERNAARVQEYTWPRVISRLTDLYAALARR